jgi:hypothetical protein
MITQLDIFTILTSHSFTYDHRTLKIELPVRSAVLKQCTGGLVVRWVTTGEYPLLYVFCLCLRLESSVFCNRRTGGRAGIVFGVRTSVLLGV